MLRPSAAGPPLRGPQGLPGGTRLLSQAFLLPQHSGSRPKRAVNQELLPVVPGKLRGLLPGTGQTGQCDLWRFPWECYCSWILLHKLLWRRKQGISSASLASQVLSGTGFAGTRIDSQALGLWALQRCARSSVSGSTPCLEDAGLSSNPSEWSGHCCLWKLRPSEAEPPASGFTQVLTEQVEYGGLAGFLFLQPLVLVCSARPALCVAQRLLSILVICGVSGLELWVSPI